MKKPELSEQDRFLITEKRDKYRKLIVDQHRKPKKDRDQRSINQAKNKLERLNKWLSE